MFFSPCVSKEASVGTKHGDNLNLRASPRVFVNSLSKSSFGEPFE
jgi:hypothetical protein